MSSTLRTWAVGVAVAALVTAANGSQGGYFSQSWGWIALAFIAPVSLALIVGSARAPRPLRLAFAGLMAALGVWVALSATWSLTPAGSLREVERILVYVGLAAAVALVLRRRDAVAVAVGVFAGSVGIAAYALATRLFPDRFESFDDPTLAYRLSEPIGYWNGLGLLAALAMLFAIGLVAHGRRWPTVALAGGAQPVLAATLYFTFSRGAWGALAVGVVAMLALDPRRFRLTWCTVALAPVSAVCVAVASRQDALTTEEAARADAVSQGQRFAVVLAGLVLGAALLALAARWSSRRIPAPSWAGRAVNAGLAGSAVLAVVVGLVLAGGPGEALAEIEERFETTEEDIEGGDLNERLFTVAGNGRAESIGLAWDAGRERPVLGHGAGSYEYLWYEERPSELVIRDAHSLYAEMFAELGVVGVGLLCLALLVPLVAAVRARRNRVVPASAAAYVAWVAHAGVDWDWEVVGVTLIGLLAGSVALLAAERGAVRALPDRARWPLLAVAVGLTMFALVSLVGNQALFAGSEAVAREEWSDAAKHARHAERLLPWSFEPHIVLGDAAAGLGDRQRALEEYRQAVEADGSNWIAWLRLAQVARGAERRAAYERVHELNPRERDLPGEPDGESP
jgi:tetratricopeptide (TPR) repeat protein